MLLRYSRERASERFQKMYALKDPVGDSRGRRFFNSRRRRGQDRGAIPVQPDKMMKTSTDGIELAKESFFRTEHDEQKSRFVCEHGFVIRKTKY